LAAGLRPDVPVDPDVRKELAARWAEAGLMEHASIAAFARFALQLLALGAPADLMSATHEAMADETEHAKMCFALASAFAGESIGPGRLPIEGALEQCELGQVLALVVREGMIGETVAAVEAREALLHAEDPVVRRVLEKIVADETRHAALAWRFAAWAIEEGGERMRHLLHEELAAAKSEALAFTSPPPAHDLRCHGILDAASRVALRRETILQVIEPCERALARQSRAIRVDLMERAQTSNA
jgi:hypothetical protein